MAKPVTEKEMNKSFFTVLYSVMWAIVAISASAGAWAAQLGLFMNIAAGLNLLTTGFGIYYLNKKVKEELDKERENQ